MEAARRRGYGREGVVEWTKDLLGPLVGLIATGVGAWIARHIKKPTDLERAQLLEKIATDAAALVVTMYPGKPWAELLTLVIQQVSTAAGLSTRNAQAIQRAASTALARFVEAPGGGK